MRRGTAPMESFGAGYHGIPDRLPRNSLLAWHVPANWWGLTVAPRGIHIGSAAIPRCHSVDSDRRRITIRVSAIASAAQFNKAFLFATMRPCPLQTLAVQWIRAIRLGAC